MAKVLDNNSEVYDVEDRRLTINEICTNKLRHLRRSEAIGGLGEQTNK